MSNEALLFANEPQCLSICPHEESADYLSVQIKSPEFNCATNIYVYSDLKALALFFENVRAKSQEASYVGVWRSVEEDLELKALIAKTGSINLEVRIDKSGDEPRWSVTCQFQMELSDLDSAAERIRGWVDRL